MKNTLSPHFHKATTSCYIAGFLALILNAAGSLLIHETLSLNWPVIIIVAVLAGLCAYLSSLRKQVAELEERIRILEFKLERK